MTMNGRTLAAGPGWYVRDMICTAGPQDRPFEEQHRTFSIAAVASGTFHYRTSRGSALLAPGAILLGNHGDCFECGLIFNKRFLFFRQKLHHSAISVRPGDRGENLSSNAKIGMPHVRTLASFGQAQGQTAEVVIRHLILLSSILLHGSTSRWSIMLAKSISVIAISKG